MKLIDLKKMNYNNINTIFSYANKYVTEKDNDIFKGIILANCLFVPTTRTALSFDYAMKKMGGEVINLNKTSSSTIKGESDEDILKKMEQCANILILYHPCNDFLYKYAPYCKTVLINGGNSGDEDHTQALVDLYTIRKYFNYETTEINILFVGDIKHCQTIHMLVDLLKKYDNISIDYYPYFGCEYSPENNVTGYEDIHKYDVVYMTRIEKEQFENNNISIEPYILNASIVSKIKKTSIILHPLPCNEELHVSVDKCVQSKYFEQINNGLYIRMALIYCLYFKKLDNSFYTLEYNYRDQLQSEIHSW